MILEKNTPFSKKKIYYYYYYLKVKHLYGPYISAHAFPLDGELTFYLKIIYFLENDLESLLIFVLFLKGKQNKKENSKCDSLFWKRWYLKNQIRARGSGYLLGKYGKDRNTSLSPCKQSNQIWIPNEYQSKQNNRMNKRGKEYLSDELIFFMENKN